MHFSDNLFGFQRPESTGERVFFRAFELFAGLATIHLAWTWGAYILRISDVVLPLGLARYLDITFLFGNNLPLWNAAAISVLVVLGFLRTRWVGRFAYAAAFALLLLQYAGRFSLGEIPHSANMAGMVLLGISIAAVAFGFGTVGRRFALGFTYFYLGLGYTLAACSKLIATGPTWVDGRHLWMWIHEKSIDSMAKSGVLEVNWLQAILLEHHEMATLVLSFGLLCETFAFLVWWRRFRTPVLIAILVMHVGIFYTMNILFKLSMIELVLLGLPWAAWIDSLLESRLGVALRTRIATVSSSPAT